MTAATDTAPTRDAAPTSDTAPTTDAAPTEQTPPTSHAPSRARLANETWEAMLTAHSVLMKRFAERDVWEIASMREYDVLYTLSKCEQPQRLSEVGRHVLLSQPALSRLVDRLVERGLLARCGDPGDGRARHVSLTDEGRAVQRRIGLVHARDVAAALTQALTDEELATMRELATRLHTSQEET